MPSGSLVVFWVSIRRVGETSCEADGSIVSWERWPVSAEMAFATGSFSGVFQVQIIAELHRENRDEISSHPAPGT